MTRWITEVWPRLDLLKTVSSQTVSRFLLACLDHAYFDVRPQFESIVNSKLHGLLLGIVNELFEIQYSDIQVARSLEERLGSIYPQEDDPEVFLPGWVRIVDATLNLLRYITDGNWRSVINSASSSFDAVAEIERQRYCRMKGSGLLDYESLEFELSSTVCQAEVQFQIDAIAAICAGEVLPRYSSPHLIP